MSSFQSDISIKIDACMIGENWSREDVYRVYWNASEMCIEHFAKVNEDFLSETDGSFKLNFLDSR